MNSHAFILERNCKSEDDAIQMPEQHARNRPDKRQVSQAHVRCHNFMKVKIMSLLPPPSEANCITFTWTVENWSWPNKQPKWNHAGWP